MSCYITSAQLDELEQLLKEYHNKHAREGTLLESCTHPKCLDAKLSIAWLRTRVDKAAD
jgi:hypothetical protein